MKEINRWTGHFRS